MRDECRDSATPKGAKYPNIPDLYLSMTMAGMFARKSAW